MTVDEFLELPEPEGEKMELLGGEVIAMSFGKYEHERVKANFSRILGVWVTENPGAEVFSETMFILDENNSPIPDISFVLAHRLPPSTGDYIHGAPDLAIEVVSLEPAWRLEEKVRLTWIMEAKRYSLPIRHSEPSMCTVRMEPCGDLKKIKCSTASICYRASACRFQSSSKASKAVFVP